MFTAKISLIFVKAFKNVAKNEGLKRFGGNSSSLSLNLSKSLNALYQSSSSHALTGRSSDQ